MPIYAYRCTTSGKTADVLVRGAEPTSCDDVREFGCCDEPGKLTRELSAPYIGRGGATSKSAPDPGGCGHCGSTPGSCVDN